MNSTLESNEQAGTPQAGNIFSDDDEESSIQEPPVEPLDSSSNSLEEEIMREIESMNASFEQTAAKRRPSTADSSPQQEKSGQKENILKISPDSDLQEINGQEFETVTPDKRTENGSNTRLPSFGERLDFRDNNRDFASEVLPDFADPNVYTVYNRDRRLTYAHCMQFWWTGQEQENPANSVVVCNLEPRVDEEILYELFSQIGQIKRMKMYRVSNKDIEDSTYLQSLELMQDFRARPHKKKAVLEYYGSNFADLARQVFNGIELFGKKIFVLKRREEYTNYCLVIIRPIAMRPWLDEFFCLDFFSRTTDLIKVVTKKYQNTQIRYFLHFHSNEDLEKAKALIKRDLKQYLNKKIKIFSNNYENVDNEQKLIVIKQKQQNANFSPRNFGIRDDNVHNFSEGQSGMQRGMEVE